MFYTRLLDKHGTARWTVPVLLFCFALGAMGSELPFSEDVVIAGRVLGTSVIDEIDVIKNGDVVWTKGFTEVDLHSDSHVHLSFGSDSDPIIRDNPRGYRIWKGYVDILLRLYFMGICCSEQKKGPENKAFRVRLSFFDHTGWSTSPSNAPTSSKPNAPPCSSTVPPANKSTPSASTASNSSAPPPPPSTASKTNTAGT